MEQEDKRTIGQLLRAAREARGMSREAAAATTRIKVVFLAAMEEDDYHLLPDEIYILRFLGEYAAFLDLDHQEIQRRFLHQIARDRSSLVVFPMKRNLTLSLRRLLPVLLLLAFFIPSVFIGLSLVANWAQDAEGPEYAGRSELVGASRPIKTLPSARETFAGDSVATATPALPHPPVPSETKGAAYTLRAQAQEMTWMLVTIDGGETRDVLLRAGETWEWRAQEGFVVTVGNAGGVELVLNGEPLPRLGEPGQVIRDLHLPAEATPPAE